MNRNHDAIKAAYEKWHYWLESRNAMAGVLFVDKTPATWVGKRRCC